MLLLAVLVVCIGTHAAHAVTMHGASGNAIESTKSGQAYTLAYGSSATDTYHILKTDSNGVLAVDLNTNLAETSDAVMVYGSDDGGTNAVPILTDNAGVVAVSFTASKTTETQVTSFTISPWFAGKDVSMHRTCAFYMHCISGGSGSVAVQSAISATNYATIATIPVTDFTGTTGKLYTYDCLGLMQMIDADSAGCTGGVKIDFMHWY
jgi:hypothetical protein